MKSLKRQIVSICLFAVTAQASQSFTVSKNVWIHESATLRQIGTDNAGTWTVTYPSLIRSGTNYNIISAWSWQGKKTPTGGEGWYKLASNVSAHATDNNNVTQSEYATFFWNYTGVGGYIYGIEGKGIHVLNDDLGFLDVEVNR